jgi:hypothetical protein
VRVKRPLMPLPSSSSSVFPVTYMWDPCVSCPASLSSSDMAAEPESTTGRRRPSLAPPVATASAGMPRASSGDKGRSQATRTVTALGDLHRRR